MKSRAKFRRSLTAGHLTEMFAYQLLEKIPPSPIKPNNSPSQNPKTLLMLNGTMIVSATLIVGLQI